MINTDKYKGYTPAPWETNSCDSQGVWQEHDESIPRHIAMVHSDRCGEDMTEAEFDRMMADKELIKDAPKLLEEVKRLTKTLELIGKNMPYDSWLHTLIKEVIGYEKVIE